MHGSRPVPLADAGRPHRRRWPFVLVALGIVGVLFAIGFRAWLTQAPSRVTVGEAVDRYRSSSAPSSAPADGAPEPGVYVYATSGSESVDALGGDMHTYPSETTITVTPTDCGFRLAWMPLSGRTDLTEICRHVNGLAIAHTVNSHEFFHMAQDERFICDGDSWWLPPADVIDWTSVCRSDGGRTTARVGHVLGTEQVQVGGDMQSAAHIRWDDTVSGSSTGTSSTDLWLDPSTGLPLRETITASTGNDTAVGRVSFEEHIDLVLISMSPQH